MRLSKGEITLVVSFVRGHFVCGFSHRFVDIFYHLALRFCHNVQEGLTRTL